MNLLLIYILIASALFLHIASAGDGETATSWERCRADCWWLHQPSTPVNSFTYKSFAWDYCHEWGMALSYHPNEPGGLRGQHFYLYKEILWRENLAVYIFAAIPAAIWVSW